MKKNLIILSVAVIAIVAGIYYFAPGFKQSTPKNILPSNNSASQNNKPAVELPGVMIKIDAKRWEYTPSVINVKKGQRIVIAINNIDRVHGINIPDLAVQGDDSIEFTTEKTGEFAFSCNNFCGDGHANMTGKIIVTD